MLKVENRINSKKELREWITYEREIYHVTWGWVRELFPVSERDILRKHQVILRKTEYYINTGKHIKSKIYKIILQRIQNKYGLHIPANTCGKGLKIMHVGPVLINGKATVGQNCSFHINTALVAGGTSDEAPTLGNNIVIGIGSVVLGKTYVANKVAIGANAVVNKDVLEEDISVAGVPAHKISNVGVSGWK